jgi:Type III restriction enzyme, res subunit
VHVSSSVRLRRWQHAALDRFVNNDQADFLTVATPGAGKTTFALVAARMVLAEQPAAVVVVTPTAHLKTQWAEAAARLQLHLDPAWSAADGDLPSDMHGVVITYQQVALNPAAVRRIAAAFRLEAARVERTWAVLSAHRQGLSIREIAAAIGLSRARVHQVLSDTAAAEVQTQLNGLRERGWPVGAVDVDDESADEDLVLARLSDEATALRECLDWLERLERDESVVVNLLPEFHDQRDFVAFDLPRVLRVLRRIGGDLDELSRASDRRSVPTTAGDAAAERRRRLAEPPPLPVRLSQREERAHLRAKLGLDL